MRDCPGMQYNSLRDYVAITWGSEGIAVIGAGQGVGPKKLFIVHMTWSTGYRTSPPPRGGFSQHLPIFAWNMPVFSQAQYTHVGMMGVHPHGSVPHFSQFNVRDWNSGRGLTFLLNNLFYLGWSFWWQKSHGRICEMKFRWWFYFINFFWAIQWCESLFSASRKNG